MAFIKEEIENEIFNTKITILEREKSEFSESWKIISMELDSFENCTPKQLRILGRWLIKEGKRIGKEYKSNGSKRINNSK